MPRVTKKELDQAVNVIKNTKIKEGTNSVPNKTRFKESTIFDKVGQPQEFLPEDQIMAKVIPSKSGEKYYVRFTVNNELHNPHDKNFVLSVYQSARSQTLPPHSLKETNSRVFENYLSFLSSNNKVFLNQATREI